MIRYLRLIINNSTDLLATPLLIVTKLEQYDYAGATALAASLLAVSFLLLLAINVLQWWTRVRHSR